MAAATLHLKIQSGKPGTKQRTAPGTWVFFIPFRSLNFGWRTCIEDFREKSKKNPRSSTCQTFPRMVHQILPNGPPKIQITIQCRFFEPFLHGHQVSPFSFQKRHGRAFCSHKIKRSPSPYIDRSRSTAWSGNPKNLSRTRRHVNPLRVRWKKTVSMEKSCRRHRPCSFLL